MTLFALFTAPVCPETTCVICLLFFFKFFRKQLHKEKFYHFSLTSPGRGSLSLQPAASLVLIARRVPGQLNSEMNHSSDVDCNELRN